MKPEKISEYFEKLVIMVLLAITAIIILITTFELVVIIIQDIKPGPGEEVLAIPLQPGELLDVFSFILLIVIGLELFEAIKQYLSHHVLQAEVILIVALTAVARKIIILNYDEYPAVKLAGIAAICLALSVSYYLIRKANTSK